MDKKLELSIIVTAWKEERTVGKAIESICNSKYLSKNNSWELILVAPDEETKIAAEKTVEELGITKQFTYLKDKCEGKPRALNMAFEKAKGEFLILTDGEVFFGENAIDSLMEVLTESERVGGVSGRPVATNPRTAGIFGYWAHLQADAVHNMRKSRDRSRVRFFPQTGYIMGVKNLDFKLPEDLFLDDAYISYFVFNEGYVIGYAPNAIVNVKYPTNWSDFIKQKFRSLIGFEQLWKYNIVSKETKSRSFWQELSYMFFPLRYAKGPLELLYSFLYYPVRLYLWVRNRLGRDIVRNAKSIREVYVRSESTK